MASNSASATGSKLDVGKTRRRVASSGPKSSVMQTAPLKPNLLLDQLTQDVVQDAAVAVVQHLLRRVDPHCGLEGPLDAVGPPRPHRHVAARGEAARQQLRQALDGVDLLAGQAQGRGTVTGTELERQH